MGLFSLARQFILRENIVIILQRDLKKLEKLGIVEKVEGACMFHSQMKRQWIHLSCKCCAAISQLEGKLLLAAAIV